MKDSGKRRVSRKAVVFLAGLCIAVLCAGLMQALRNRPGSFDGEAFDAYTEKLFRESIGLNTLNLHYTLAYPENYGITDYAITLGNYTGDEVEKDYEDLEDMKKELLRFDLSALTEEQRLTYDILLDYAETELSVKNLVYYSELLGKISGYQSQLPVILAEYTFRTERDIQDYLALISQIDEMFQEVMEFEKEKSRAGLFMPDFAVDEVIGQCEKFIENPEENYMIEVFDDKIDAFEELTGSQREAYKKENREIIISQVVEGYQTLIDGLNTLKGSGKNDLGLCYYDKGKKYYEYLIRSKTGSPDTVGELQDKVYSFMLERLSDAQAEIKENPGSYDEFVDYQPPFTDPEQIVADLITKIGRDFPDPPRVGHTIKYVHPSMQEYMSPAFYLTTPIDDLQNNLIYINGKYMEDEGDLYTTLAHEGYPGHLYQHVCTNAYGIAPIRDMLSYRGYSEGWATYVEFEYACGYEGMSEGAADIAAANSQLSLGMYTYADMGIHYYGWDREDMAEFLMDFGIDDEDAVNEVFDTLVEEPTVYPSYFIGYLEFLDLRKQAQEELGDEFDIREFHDFILKTGPAPFYIIENHMEKWMRKQ